jgi:hypothetical protein
MLALQSIVLGKSDSLRHKCFNNPLTTTAIELLVRDVVAQRIAWYFVK